MATAKALFLPTHPGERGLFSPSDVHFPDDKVGGRAPDGGVPAFLTGMLFQKDSFNIVGGGHTPILVQGAQAATAVGPWTFSIVGTNGAAIMAATKGGGYLLTAGSTSTFSTNLQSIPLWTPVASKRVVGLCRVQTSDITTVGFEYNMGSSAVAPATTNYTDVIGVKMGVGAGTVLGKVRGNSGTVANSATLATMVAATDYFFGFTFSLSATAGSVDGGFFAGATLKDATWTPFTTAQQAQAAAILTSPPSMYQNINVTGSAGNPTATFTSALMFVDN